MAGAKNTPGSLEVGVAPSHPLSPRLARLPRADVDGVPVPVAGNRLARLLGLAGIRRERAGPGLLIPHCSSVHTLGMRFALELRFLAADGRVLRRVPRARPGRFFSCRGAAAVIELPASD